ncbi:putative sucrose phosphorylase [Ilumatobacter coccineus YM16-304]|uniref:Sucrose 6(F)-phosphate phosphorylase n=3 Tax=Ilumatobacter coccineus TaxID=467094 RepID=SUCPP_ILUCY|nr:RecName: Full=Sucrose 6(F)-phosphate phosphorylase; Short=SPP; AltName: Full=Sucrose 6'-phosphate phosphorylase [Ilumatobacter coccineus YM16-304]BAN03569.1 putative sucrose phosphorylase [Ilumatobacter coccineus YM16-304]
MTHAGMKASLPNRVMLNAYPDSIDGDLAGTVRMLQRPEFTDAFGLFYVLPSIFNSDLDRGFSIIDYDLNSDLASAEDLAALDELGIMLKFDMVLNHLSVGSPQFQDLLKHGDDSAFRDFFIDWNEFWEGEGELHADGHVVPSPEHLDRLFMRKPGLPILQVRFPDGSDRFYWNTFYQRVETIDGERSYLGQMDLNAESPRVWTFYRETFEKLARYGAKIVRLDAFAYLHKAVGDTNFFNTPGTWDHLDRLRTISEENGLVLLPEIHGEYGTKIHEELSDRDYPVYDFFFPGLVIDAIDSASNTHLLRWIDEIIERDIATVNMLGCHDGIPVIDLKGGPTGQGLLPDATIEAMISRLLERGGRVKNLYGADGTKVSYYQVNATFFSALGESDARLRLARAIQLFVPGTPQVWYLDLFAGANDVEAADRAGADGHKEINRTNLSAADVEAGLARPIVLDQLEMIRLRNASPAFDGRFEVVPTDDTRLQLRWQNGSTVALLDADLATERFTITHEHDGHTEILGYD